MSTRDLALATLVMLIWGFNFSMIKMGVSAVDPLLATAARFTAAVIPMIFFIRKPDVAWRYLVAYGVVFGVGVWGMASWSITAGLSSGMSSVLMQTNVLFSILVGVFFFNERLSKRKLFGVSFAIAGLIVSVIYTNGNVTLFGLILVTLSAISWALVGVIVKSAKVKQAFAFNVWGMAFAPIPLVLLTLFINGDAVIIESFHAWDVDTSMAILFQAYPTTLFGYWVFNNLLIRYPLSTVAPLTLLVPIFALLSGYLMYGETLTNPQIIACGLFLCGILMIVIGPVKKQNTSAKHQHANSTR
ncbi:EamA family transporter [Veronia pacifica]|uniref:EamA domain-containing protein n=1 Tax=Veronia pacifica TaxID=1080227 RepID=A0A1C3EDH0_9GAMM|nr:EamA family transporter [Veronia pacifica]ODA31297.1 hypothetical protein A8L45_17550 [Veronia pacifica]